MNKHLPVFLSQWEWAHWLVLAVVLMLSVNQVYKRQANRIQAEEFSNVDVIEEDIKAYNTQAERLAQLEVLPPVRSQWSYVTAITDQYGVDLSLVSDKNVQGSYNGPLASWTADLKGTVGAVLVAAKEIQAAVPAYLYDITLKGNDATIRLSVLGSE
ncbi:hypothetical protein A9Q81_07290 [Gammaproteobacteria bacterium 42_54_T18]|nr:hypothetical protein A9Q81_07290 [Gammaproteobacteria bacterium 42_54_T18]